MFPNNVIVEYRDGGGRASPAAEARAAEAALHAMEQWLAAERALDAVLADSFPASDPPPWTLGVPLRRED